MSHEPSASSASVRDFPPHPPVRNAHTEVCSALCVGRVRDALNTLDALKPGSRPLTLLLLALLLALSALGSSCDQSGVYVATGGLGEDVGDRSETRPPTGGRVLRAGPPC